MSTESDTPTSRDEEIPTPRTDHEQRAYVHTQNMRPVKASFARQLERELVSERRDLAQSDTELCQLQDALGCPCETDNAQHKAMERIRDLISAEGELGDLREDLARLSAELEKEREELLDMASSDVAYQNSFVVQLHATLAEREEELSELRSDKDVAEQTYCDRIKHIQAELAEREKELSEAKAECSKWERRANEKQKPVRALGENLEDARAQLLATQAELAQSKQSLEVLTGSEQMWMEMATDARADVLKLKSVIEKKDAYIRHHHCDCRHDKYSGKLLAQCQRCSALALSPDTTFLDEWKQKLAGALSLVDWAESILCNSVPMGHCTQAEWDEIITRWRDQKHEQFRDGDDPFTQALRQSTRETEEKV